MISEWQSIWPNRHDKLGRLQTLQWLVICLFLAVYVTTYFRVSLQVVFKILELKLVGRSESNTLYHALTTLFTILVYWRLKIFIQRCLHAPCYALSEGHLRDKADNSWKQLLALNGACVLLPAYSVLHPLMQGRTNLTLVDGLQLLLLLLICLYSFRLAIGSLLTSPTELPEGKVGAFTQLVISVAIWSNACSLLSSAYFIPYYPADQYQAAAIRHAAWGSLLALSIWKLKGVKGPVILGLAASVFGGPVLGIWLARGIALLGVFGLDWWKNRSPKLALVRMWGFGLGQATGRIVGGALGVFYLGLDGGGIGASIGEALAATMGFHLVTKAEEES